MGGVTKYATIYVRSIYTSIWTCQDMFFVYVEEENLPLHVFIYKCKYRYMKFIIYSMLSWILDEIYEGSGHCGKNTLLDMLGISPIHKPTFLTNIT